MFQIWTEDTVPVKSNKDAIKKDNLEITKCSPKTMLVEITKNQNKKKLSMEELNEKFPSKATKCHRHENIREKPNIRWAIENFHFFIIGIPKRLYKEYRIGGIMRKRI